MNETLVILAGGLATRLRPIIEKIPKSLIQFNGKPFIHYQLTLLKKKGFKNILICAGYLGRQIKNFMDNYSYPGLSIKYSFDGDKLLGTGGAILKAENMLSDPFFVIYGDCYLDMDYKKILEYFNKYDCLGSMAVYENKNRWDKSNVIYKNSMIKLYDKKTVSPEMSYIDYGLSLLSKKALELIITKKGYYDLADLLNLLSKQHQLLGFIVNKRFYEIGSIKGIEDFNNYLIRGKRKTNVKRK